MRSEMCLCLTHGDTYIVGQVDWKEHIILCGNDCMHCVSFFYYGLDCGGFVFRLFVPYFCAKCVYFIQLPMQFGEKGEYL